MRIGDISKPSPTKLQTIEPGATVREASRKLVKFNIGGLPVCDSDGELVGIITERDILRLVAADDCHDALERKVAAVMTRKLITAVAADDIEKAMRIMTERRIRHLPIVEGKELVGILSIGDVVKSKLDESSAEIRYLRDYVTG
jgi:CBS domain-containing protein